MQAPWDATEATWLEASAGEPWTVAGAGSSPDDFRGLPTTSSVLLPGDWSVFDVGEFVEGWVAGDMENEGFIMIGESSGSVEYTLGGSTHTQPGYRPLMVVEWSP